MFRGIYQNDKDGGRLLVNLHVLLCDLTLSVHNQEIFLAVLYALNKTLFVYYMFVKWHATNRTSVLKTSHMASFVGLMDFCY